MGKYQILLDVLGSICSEAPPNYKRYHVPAGDIEAFNHSRSLALLHLFLKANFGLLDFLQRESLITDGAQDGGIDAYYIDEEAKRIFLIQAKFRTSEKNFNEKDVSVTDLLQMDIDRITEGSDADERNVPYNEKIKALIAKLRAIPDIARYKYEIAIIANVASNISQTHLKKLAGGHQVAIYNHERVYRDLLFPIVHGTYYNPSDLKIAISLANTSSSQAKISYTVKTESVECDITVVFVPTLEIARTLYKYRNAILKYNPRSYLEMSTNVVNIDIASSITNIETNEFALFNNGITMLSYDTTYNEKTGHKGRAQLMVTRPQVINGGQTAFTLSRVYEQEVLTGKSPRVFEGKEVLLKVITFSNDDAKPAEEADTLRLIEAISKATNQQSPVNEADRRSNDRVQVRLQEHIYNKYGYFYERKRGEFADGLRAKYIQRNLIIDRETFLRVCKCCQLDPANARRMSVDQLFEKTQFDGLLNSEARFDEYFFAFKCYEFLRSLRNQSSRNGADRFGQATYGQGLQYGLLAVVTACRIAGFGELNLNDAESVVTGVLQRWREFEERVIESPNNSDYFRVVQDPMTGTTRQLNFTNYYKSPQLIGDLSAFFKK